MFVSRSTTCRGKKMSNKMATLFIFAVFLFAGVSPAFAERALQDATASRANIATVPLRSNEESLFQLPLEYFGKSVRYPSGADPK